MSLLKLDRLSKFLSLVDGHVQWNADNLNLKENLHVGEIIWISIHLKVNLINKKWFARGKMEML